WWLDWQGLTLAEAKGLRDAALAVLEDGEPRTRAEIGAAVGGPLGKRLAADSWGHYLAPAGSFLCHGPPRGRNVTFVRCDRWLPDWREPRVADAVRAVVSRYLETYGPARREEIEHWLALKLPEDALADFEEIEVEGRSSYVVPGPMF